MRFTTGVLLSAFALAACQGGDVEEADGEVAPVNSQEDGVSEPKAAEAEAPEPSPTPSSDARFTSAYTDVVLDDCTMIQSEEEGEWSLFKCPGYEGIPYWLAEGDLRTDVDAGVQNEKFQTIGAFNDIGARIEWRMDKGKPFAIIFRYRDTSMEGNGRSVLAIEKIGNEGDPGCRVAQIAGSTPNANVLAREIADSKTATFDCANDPEYIGSAR